jgi:hypothetical protein
MKITASIYNEIGDKEIEIKISGTYTANYRGKRDKWGAQLEPDEPDSIEDIEATVDGVERELSDEEKGRAMEALWESY